MRVALFLFSNGFGGAEKRFLNYFKLSKDQCDIKINLFLNEILFDNFVKNKLLFDVDDIFVLKDPLKFFAGNVMFARVFTVVQRLYRIMQLNTFIKKGFEYEICHGVLDGVRYLSLMTNLNIKIISSLVSTRFNDLEKKGLKTGYLISDALDCLNENIAKKVQSDLLVDKSVIHITPGTFIDSNIITEGNEKKRQIIFCGRLIDVKNPLMFLEMASLIHFDYGIKDVKYIMLGDGPLLARVKRKYKELKHAGVNIELEGHVSDPSKYFKDSLIFVQMTSSETHATQVLLEAMANECAVVTTDLPGVEKTVTHGFASLSFLSADEFAKNVVKLLENISETIERGKIARRYFNDNYTFANYFRYITNLYTRSLRKIKPSITNSSILKIILP